MLCYPASFAADLKSRSDRQEIQHVAFFTHYFHDGFIAVNFVLSLLLNIIPSQLPAFQPIFFYISLAIFVAFVL
jgi:hypothetical protein